MVKRVITPVLAKAIREAIYYDNSDFDQIAQDLDVSESTVRQIWSGATHIESHNPDWVEEWSKRPENKVYRFTVAMTKLRLIEPKARYCFRNRSYAITPDGRVFSLMSSEPRLLIPTQKEPGSAYRVQMSHGGRYAYRLVALEVLRAFKRRKDYAKVNVRFIDGNYANHHLDNLEWSDKSDKGVRSRRRPTKDEQREMLAYIKLGEKMDEIANAFGVSPSYVKKIKATYEG